MMTNYLEMREDEARRLNEFRVAEDASRRLRDRLSGKLGTRATGEVEESIKQEVMGNFDFASAHSIMLDAQRRSRMESNQISDLLVDLKAMCQMAMNPEMREKIDNPNKTAGDMTTYSCVSRMRSNVIPDWSR